jgi:hypothetical protein
MGERGKNEEMKNRRTSIEAVAPNQDKPDTDQPQTTEAMGRPVNPSQKPEARLGREVQARIGQQLRAMYDDVVNQGVPQRINDLIAKLSQQD